MSARLVGCLLVAIFGTEAARADEPVAGLGTERFEKKVRPLLADRCWSCHGPEKTKGGLRLDSSEAVARGGDSGPVLVAGKPDESLLIKAVRYHDETKMPPKGKLPEAEVLELVEWVRSGANWPGADPARSSSMVAPPVTKPSVAAVLANGPFWAFRPVVEPSLPTVKAAAWPRSPLDRFILSALEQKGLAPAPSSEKRALIRRASSDLTGLPPTPEEVEAFLADPSDQAFERVVDRLLASPRYGERWGRHWLDLARYADSNGMDENMAYANAHRYRDYVIRAFNADRPYDQFLKEQIAGDLLPSSDDEATNLDRLTATGFLVLGPKMLAEDDPLKMEMDIIDEQVDTVGRVFLGLTIGCARCHDHKFDPIPTTDYYAMAGIFKSTKSMQNHKVVAMWNERTLATKAERSATETHKQEVARLTAEVASRLDQVKRDIQAGCRSRLAGLAKFTGQWDRYAQARPVFQLEGLAHLAKNWPDNCGISTFNQLIELRSSRESLDRLTKATPATREAMGVDEQAPINLRVHLRGSFLTLGETVPRGFPKVLAGDQGQVKNVAASGRLELAEWLGRGDHPLTARVMVNRIWLEHFGEGLVRSPDNFGLLGDRPDHPELLDWLARRFVESGWSIKAMHRLILLSSTYQMGTKYNPDAALADPDNRLLWHMTRRRLDAEAIRDAILAVSGELDPSMGGSLLPTKNHAYVNNTEVGGDLNYDVNRRSVYLPVIRSGLYNVFQAFDFADPSASNGKRIPTTVAPQALFMMNDRLVLRCSEALGRRLLARTDLDAAGRIQQAYRSSYGRSPTAKELDRAQGYLRRFEAELEARGVAADARPLRVWQAYCQAMFASSEFLYLD